MIQDHKPIEVSKFGGIWRRDAFNDSVPFDHFINSLNVVDSGAELVTRDGISLSITLANLRRARVYKRQGEASRLLILDSSYQLFDATASLVTPILTITGMTDFDLEVVNNLAFITPSNGSNGLAGSFVYIYNGTTARKAAGVAPSSGFTATISATAGVIEIGTHIFAWCFETDSGFVTAPGPDVFQTLVFDGTKAVDFSGIPAGPTGTSARRLVASRAIQDYNGNQEGYEMFFVSGGRIANNTATTLSAVDFFDADLQVSADYTFDQLDEIPAVLFMTAYGNKLCYGSTDEDKSLMYVSKDGESESINSLAGFISFDPNETEGIKDALEFRDVLYVTKALPGRTYAVTDNSYEASTWKPITIDGSVGANYNGLSVFIDSKGAKSNCFLTADTSGLFKFSGIYEEIPLSYKIKKFWSRINKAAFNKVQVVIDSEKDLIYIVAPLDNATVGSHLFVANFSNGLTWNNISWHIWTFGSVVESIAGIVVDINNTTKETYLRLVNYSGNVYNQVIGQRHDENTAIDSSVTFASLFQIPNWVHHFGGVGLRVKGSGTLAITFLGEDSIATATLPSITLADSPGKEYFKQSLFVNEKCSVKIRTNTADHYFTIRVLNLYCKPLWSTRPGA